MPKSQIKKEIIDILGQETFYYTKEYGQQVQNQINKWLDKKKELNKKLNNYYKQSKKTQEELSRLNTKGKEITLSSTNLKRLYYKYVAASRHIADLKTLEDISDFYKQGYVLIHKIREDITKQNLTYSILTKFQQEKMELHLTLPQILEIATIQFQDIKNIDSEEIDLTKATSLKIKTGDVNKFIKQQLKQETNELSNILKKIDKELLWDRLAELTPHKKGDSHNFGHIYEVYYVLRNVKRYKTINYIGNRQMGLYEKLLKNSRNSIEGWKIGDVGTEQLKSVFRGAAGLMNAPGMENTLIEIRNAFAQASPEEIKKSLKKIFTTQAATFDNRLDEKAEEEAIAAIDKFIDGINRT